MEIEDSTSAPRRKGKTEPWATLCWDWFLFSCGTVLCAECPKRLEGHDSVCLEPLHLQFSHCHQSNPEMHCYRLGGWKISSALCCKPVNVEGFFVGFCDFCCIGLLLFMYRAQRLQKTEHKARIPWCRRLQAQSSCFSMGSLQRYLRWALQTGLCQTFTACLLFSSFCVSVSQCTLSAIKCQIPIHQFSLNVTLPCQGLVEASWSTYQAFIKVIWILSYGRFYLSSLDLSTHPSVLKTMLLGHVSSGGVVNLTLANDCVG